MDGSRRDHELRLKALQKRTADIVKSGISYRDLALSLYSEEIISKELYDKVFDDLTGKDSKGRLQQIVQGLRSSIEADPNVFSKFIDVLNDLDELAAKNLAKKLQETLAKLSSEEEKLISSSQQPTRQCSVDKILECHSPKLQHTKQVAVDGRIINREQTDESSKQQETGSVKTDFRATTKQMMLSASTSNQHGSSSTSDIGASSSSSSANKQPKESTDSADIRLNLPDGARDYQKELARPGENGENYIICAPTGSGKTVVAAMIIRNHLLQRQSVQSKGTVLFIVKTVQLAHQQKAQLERYLSGISVVDLTGESSVYIYTMLSQVDIVVCTSGKLYSELHNKLISLSSATLLIFDECHHATAADLYARIMEWYLIDKKDGKRIPQVIGMTASPGAGKGKSLDQVIEHQLKLCARLNATSGIKCVQQFQEELRKIVPVPDCITTPLPSRPHHGDPFIDKMHAVMFQLEKQLPIQSIPEHDRSSIAYQHWVKREMESARLSEIGELRDQISILELLEVYVLALLTYEDFELTNAKDVLDEGKVQICCQDNLNDTEEKLKQIHLNLNSDVRKFDSTLNPLLIECEELLFQHFSSKPDSKGIFFVRAIKHTDYVAEWIKSSPKLSKLIRPSPIAGYSRKGMTEQEQISTIKKFRSGEFNLLTSTSVLEEGLDVPDCNFIIRFQILSNEISDVQAQGRARAEDSTMHTIVTSRSPMHYKHLLNNDRKFLATEGVRQLSNEKIDPSHLARLQNQILAEREWRLFVEESRQSIWETKDVILECGKCRTFACHAKHVCRYGSNPSSVQYIVPLESFVEEKMRKKKRTGGRREPKSVGGFNRPFKIHCIKCDHEWGIWGSWFHGAIQYPVIKCASFIFHNKLSDPNRHTCKHWKTVLFHVRSYEDFMDADSDEDSAADEGYCG